MQITLTPKSGGSTFTFPALPEKVEVRQGASYKTYNLISKGTIKIPKGRDSTQVSWSHVFFGKSKKKEAVVDKNHWKKPKECIKTLDKWMNNGTKLNLIVSGCGVNIDVTIASFQYSPYGAFGNISYTISFEEDRPIKVHTTKEKKVGGGKKDTKERPASSAKKAKVQETKKYSITSGDTLWAVSKQFCGDGAKWEEVYEKNKDAIESDAKKHGLQSSDHGKHIWPGLKLEMP